MVSGNLLGCLAIAFIYPLVAPQQSPPQEASHPIKVTFAVVVEGKEPLSAEVSCLPDDTCRLAKNDDLGIDLAITVFSGSETHGELSIYCWPNSCSFRDLRSRIAFFGRRTTVDILSGEPDFGIETLLVIRERPKIGEVLISY